MNLLEMLLCLVAGVAVIGIALYILGAMVFVGLYGLPALLLTAAGLL